MKNSRIQLFRTSLVMISMVALAALSISPAYADTTYTWHLVSCGKGNVSIEELPGKPGLGHWRFASSNRFIKLTNGATGADDAGAQLRVIRENATARFRFEKIDITTKGPADKLIVRLCFLKDGEQVSFERKLGQFKHRDKPDGFVEYTIDDKDFPGFNDGPLIRRPLLVRATFLLSGPSSPPQTVLIGRTQLIENTWIYPDNVVLQPINCSQAATCP